MSEIFICYLTRYKKEELVKICHTFKAAKKWQHEQNKIIMAGELLHAAYLKSMHFKFPHITKKYHLRKNKHADAWYDYLKKNNYDGTETRSSAYFHRWEIAENGN